MDVSDLAILAANYRKHVTGGWSPADFNNDGVVDVKDLAILAANYRYGVVGRRPGLRWIRRRSDRVIVAGRCSLPESTLIIWLRADRPAGTPGLARDYGHWAVPVAP